MYTSWDLITHCTNHCNYCCSICNSNNLF